jgi:hypothetical protein
MRRNSIIASVVLTMALAASVWANCAAEAVVSAMACCATAQQECGPADLANACCGAEQSIRHNSVAGRVERPADGTLTGPSVLALRPGLAASQIFGVRPPHDISEQASSPRIYLLDSVLRV